MSDADEIAILRIELAGIEPLIWRRVAVRATTNLQTLHRIIQAAMGWLDYHLWEFEAVDILYGVPDPDGAAWGHVVRRASTTKLSKLLKDGPTTFGYTYDLGDNWEHQIIVERLQAAEPSTLYPVFLGGQRRCPPEDCGSVPGYYDFLDAVLGPDRGKGSRKKREMLTWYGRPYDPDNIDEERVRAALAQIAQSARPRKAPVIEA